MLFWGHRLVVLDYVSSIVVFGEDFAAMTGPDHVPVITVGGVLWFVKRDVGECADAFGEFGHLRQEADIPICVVFHDECGCKLVLDDTEQALTCW